LKGIGLKAKTLLGLSTLLILSISSNLLFTNTLLISDKKAYIFENILTATEESKKIIEENIQNSLFQAEAMALVAIKNPAELPALFEKQNLLEAIEIKQYSSPDINRLMKKNFPEKSEGYVDFISKWLESKKEPYNISLNIKKIEKYDLFELSQQDLNKQVRVLVNMENLWNRISNDLVFNYIVLQGKNSIIWKTSNEIPDGLKDELLKTTSTSATRELNTGNLDYLTSISSLKELDLHVIGYIPSSKAYAVVGDLSVKTIAFGLVLLGISIIVGLLFSMRLTGPIRSLLEGVIHVSDGNFTHKVIVKSKDELLLLGEKFNFMSGKISDLLDEKEIIIDELRDANAKIEDYSKNLELKVEERTRELKSANDFIQAMINSLDQGLFVFDPQLKCSPIYTKACEDLFQCSPSGKTLPEILSLNEEQTDTIEKWADILFPEKIPFESASQLGILEKTYGDSVDDKDYKVLKIHYHPMRNENNEILNVVAVATDKTDEMRAIEESKKKERYVEMIFKILGGKRQFIDFISEMEDQLRVLDEALSHSEPDLAQAMLIYHSFNGGLAMYAVDHLVKEARACEQTIVDMKKQGKINRKVLILEKQGFSHNYRQFKQDIFATLGFQGTTVEIDQAIILFLNELVQKTDNKELKHVFNEKIMKVPMEEFFKPYKNLLPVLAEKLGKEIAPLEINVGDLRVPPDDVREFFSMLVHLFRNCADHGIELPHVREERQKEPAGHISVDALVDREKRVMRLIVKDDGGGIDPKRIRKKLKEKYPHNKQIDSMPDQDIIYRIFDPDFSTAEEVTSISGRGVGMSAIKDVVDRMHGRIKIESVVGKGTKFIFDLPLSS
jgi:two-component system chemotaxis sensor kinase CheA